MTTWWHVCGTLLILDGSIIGIALPFLMRAKEEFNSGSALFVGMAQALIFIPVGLHLYGVM